MRNQSGFIALTSAIIISVLLLAITAAISLTGYFGRFNVLDSQSKERGLALAESCGNVANLDIAENTVPGSFPASVTIGSDTCSIAAINLDTPAVGEATIKTQAVVNRTYSNLLIVLDTDTFTVQSLTECTNLTASAGAC